MKKCLHKKSIVIAEGWSWLCTGCGLYGYDYEDNYASREDSFYDAFSAAINGNKDVIRIFKKAYLKYFK